jgi:Epoxide hydrolase N terminus
VSTSVNALTPAPIAVEERVLEDLRSRLRATIWPEDEGNEDGRYGVPRALLQELTRYWAQEYDWRAAERAMNAYEHYLVDVSGTRVHFMRKPGVGPDPTPLILSHGWPGPSGTGRKSSNGSQTRPHSVATRRTPSR